MAYATFVRRILLLMAVLGFAVAHAQTLTKVQGDGQLVIPQFSTSNPLVVKVRDASGNPVPNVQVTWTVDTPGLGFVIPAFLTGATKPGLTDANGNSTATFGAQQPPLNKSYTQGTVTATYAGVSVHFTETAVGETSETPDVQASPNPPAAAGAISGAAGQQGSVPIVVQFAITQGGQAGQGGIPNVGVTATMDDLTNPSTISCAGGIAFSNAAGAATCNLVFGGKIGAGTFTLSAGGFQNFDYRYAVVAGPPATINFLSGNGASGSPGQPITLTAQLTDGGGNALSGIAMTWAVVVPGTVTLSTTSSITDNTGRVSTTATLGNTSGPVQVQLSTADGKVTALFNLTVNVVVAGLNLVSGSGQSVLVNQPFPNPLIVQVNDANSNPVAGVPVTFTLTSGIATLSGTNVTTLANGQASITVTAGATAGAVVITVSTTAGNNIPPVQFNLTATPLGPVCDAQLSDNATFFNGASYAPNFISPGGIALIYCQGIANGIQGVVTSNSFGFGPLPTQVQGVTVQFGDAPVSAPIYYLANQNGKQWIAVQVPFGVLGTNPSGSLVPVVVTANGEPNVNQLSASVMAGAPGFLEYVMSDGKSRAIILHADGSVVDVDTPQHMAQPGETLTAFVTGLIPPTDSSGNSVIQTNEFAPPGSPVTITTPIVLGIGKVGVPPPVTATYAPDLIGVWEVTFVVPSNTSSGDKALNIGIPDPTNNNKLILNKRGSVIPIN
jgi:uncharacterized protein (TIGR03437 family)